MRLRARRGASSGAPGGDAGAAAWFLRRQLVLAGVAGAVVLVAVVGVVVVIDQGPGAASAALRPAADGSGVTAVSPVAETSRAATWAVGAALVAVAAVLTLLLDHAFRVARFAVLARPGRPFADEAAIDAAREDR